MIIRVDRKELNEKNDYILTVEEHENNEVIHPDDDSVIELLYEILTNKD